MNSLISLDQGLLIVLGAGLGLAIIIFLFAGIYKVKKNHVILVEKMKKFHGIYKSGLHFFLPVIYTREGYYCVEEMEKTVQIVNGKKLKIRYKIEDVKKYHYSYITIEKLLNKIRDNYESIDKDILIEEFNKLGLKFISIREA